jgi:hypothetical protein
VVVRAVAPLVADADVTVGVRGLSGGVEGGVGAEEAPPGARVDTFMPDTSQ